MNQTFASGWDFAGQLGMARLTAADMALLVVLGALLAVLRVSRERYLLLWIVGWTALLASRLVAHGALQTLSIETLSVVEQAGFVVAIGLFATAVFDHGRGRKLVSALLLATGALAIFAAVRVVAWPSLLLPRVILEIAYRIGLLSASVELLQTARGRRHSGQWLLCVSLPFLHLPWTLLSASVPAVAMLIADVAAGAGMLLVVYSDLRARAQRLAAIQRLSSRILRDPQAGTMAQIALEEILKATGAKAAWFRTREAASLVATHCAGTSKEFLRAAGTVAFDAAGLFPDGLKIVVSKAGEEGLEDADLLRKERIRQVVLVPVAMRKTLTGVIELGCTGTRFWSPEELEFLSTCAGYFGYAQEGSRLQEQVLRSQRQWVNTFDSIHDVILAHDDECRIVKANQVLLEHLGKALADVTGKLCESVLPRSGGAWSGCPYCSRGDQEYYEGADLCFGGFSAVSTSSYTEEGDQKKGTIHFVRDTTDRRSAEDRYRMLFEQVQEGVFVARPDGSLIDCNDAFVRMVGYGAREEVMALNLHSDISADASQRNALKDEIEAHNYVRNFEIALRRKDGSLLLAEESSFATRNAKGEIERYQGFVLDVTERRQAEDEMRRRNRELNALNAMAVVATQSFDLDEILNLTLRQVVSLFGAESGLVYLGEPDGKLFRRRAMWGARNKKSRAVELTFAEGFGELVMRSRAEVLSAEYLPHLPKAVADLVTSEEDHSWLWVFFWGKDHPTGIMGLCSHSGYTYSSNEENLLVAISRQLATTIEKVRLYEETCIAYDDLRRTQEQLLQSEKMSAVGQLIAGVAHELNNPLTAILGYSQLLESEGLNPRAQEYIAKLFKQAQRTHRIVQSLLSFARQRKPQREEVNVCKVLDETLTLRDYDLKTNSVAVEREVEENLPAVVADPHQVEQVFLNILNNAVDAILGTGKAGKLKIRAYRQHGQVCVQFADDGPGFKEPKRIFDPFYTTKAAGKGTGLGLSICYGIVKEHGGNIVARNADEGGAIIEVRLPAAATSMVSAEIEPVPLPHREAALAGKVLLLETEESVLDMERDVLMGAGATVVALKTASDARARLASETFDAFLMSARTAGDWSAKEAYEWLREHCPGLETHFLATVSNGQEFAELRNFLQERNVPYMVKPFEIAELISQVRRLLQKASAAGAS